MSLNKCMIIGNLGRDPEMRYTPSGQAVTQFTVATNRNYRTSRASGRKRPSGSASCVWGQQAERAAEHLRKGNKVYVEGRIQTRQWEDQDGQKRYTTELDRQPGRPRSSDASATTTRRSRRARPAGERRPSCRAVRAAGAPARRQPRAPPSRLRRPALLTTRPTTQLTGRTTADAPPPSASATTSTATAAAARCAPSAPTRLAQIDYKEVNRLRRYLSERAKIEPRRKTGTCAQHQRELSVALKRARHVALLPYSPQHLRP